MRKIYKYPIRVEDAQVIEMPERPGGRRCLALVGTGHSCEGLGCKEYVGTFQIYGGSLVFHLFNLGYQAQPGVGRAGAR